MSFNIPIDFLGTLAGAGAIVVSLRYTMMLIESQKTKIEQEQAKLEINTFIDNFGKVKQASNADVLELMLKNVAELKEYYTMNKQQARNAFSAALWISFLGFALFACGLIMSYFSTSDGKFLAYSGVSGAIVEIIAGLFFWLYKQSLTQLNLFHESLRNTEKFLTAIKLIENVSDTNRDLMYAYIVQNIFASQKEVAIVKNELSKTESKVKKDESTNES